MDTLVWTLAGILVLNLVVLGVAVALEQRERHRLFRALDGPEKPSQSPAGPGLHLVRAPAPPSRQGFLRRASFVVALASMIAASVVAFVTPVGESDANLETATHGTSAFAARAIDGVFAPPESTSPPVPDGIEPVDGATDAVEVPSVAVSGEASIPNVVAAESGSATTVRLVWAAVPDAIAYSIERWDDGTTDALPGWERVATTSAPVTSYIDGGLESGTTYYYRVAAITDEGPEEPSDPVAVTTEPAPPVAPVIEVTVAGTTVSLTWADLADETGYRIERSEDEGATWAVVATAGQDVTAYEDAGLAFATTYLYRVVATNDGGESAASNVAAATTEAEPVAGADDEENPGGADSVDPGDGALAEPIPAEDPDPLLS